MQLETILTPAELPALAHRDWRGTACVVFDILRATSTFVAALHHGAEQMIPVGDIAAAVARRQQDPSVRLAGERGGVRIPAALSGGTDFDFGNSPREFTPERVRGQTIVSTTTNGTRALRACVGAEAVLAGSFLNLAATADFLRANHFARVLLVCAGTLESVALEDVLAAGALAESLAAASTRCDATLIAVKTFVELKTDLAAALGSSRNGRRLLALPELRDDVAFCAQRDVCHLVAAMDAAGALRAV
jgi:2-phosphosulfolactate phosphatase